MNAYICKGGFFMKRNRLLGIMLILAAFSGVLCSGIIIVTGIRQGSSAHASSPLREKYPQPYTLEKTKLENFSSASICLDYADISILPADDFYLEYRLDGTCQEPDYGVRDGVFHFQEGSAQRQYTISFNLFGNPVNREPFYLNLYVPADQYFELLTMSVESGNVKLEQISAKEADVTLEYGDLTLEEFSGTTLNISSESGNTEAKTITCDDLTVSASYGDFTGGTISVSGSSIFDLESGNLEISSLTAGIFSAENAYGNCDVEHITAERLTCSLESGNLTLKDAAPKQAEVNMEYGDVTLRLADTVSDYSYDLETEYGDLNIDGTQIEPDEDGTVLYRKQNGGKKKSIQIHCESGSVTIR